MAWGKNRINLHINYESVKPYDLEVVDNSHLVKDKNYKLKLKVDKINKIIVIDEHMHILGIPESAWLYKLGNRSALDQYKEKK